LGVEAISSIEPVSQFSDTEASSIVHFKYDNAFTDGNLVVKFKFQKNIDKKWILTSLELVDGGITIGLHEWEQENQNINIVAQ
jgi:hypothetical protein